MRKKVSKKSTFCAVVNNLIEYDWGCHVDVESGFIISLSRGSPGNKK